MVLGKDLADMSSQTGKQADKLNPADKNYHSGFACLVGRPNAGKSTLTNALVGEKIAITSSKPETTRHSVRAVITTPKAQMVLIDTPGLHKPRTLLGQRLNDVVRETWSEVDVIGVCFPSQQRVGPGDEFLVREIAKLRHQPKLVAVLTKTDLVSKERLASHIQDVLGLEEKIGVKFEAFVPCSAKNGEQVDTVLTEFLKLLPPGPMYYPDGQLTDEPIEVLVTELIREAALEDLRDELPHSLAVEIDEIRSRPDRPVGRELLDVFASMVVERDSQKGILIGKGGSQLKAIGIKARQQLQKLLGQKVHLELKVKVLKDWQRDTKHLKRLGF